MKKHEQAVVFLHSNWHTTLGEPYDIMVTSSGSSTSFPVTEPTKLSSWLAEGWRIKSGIPTNLNAATVAILEKH